jgi:dephospho-CoA kinase
MSFPRRIGIMGKMGSGKTTLANNIIKQAPGFVRYSFGEKVKTIAKDLFGVDYKDRNLLQAIGSKMRDIRSSVWIDYVINQIVSQGNSLVVIDDVRYLDEIEALQRCGFYLIYLDTPEETRLNRLEKRDPYFDIENYHTQDQHISERVDQYRSYADEIVAFHNMSEISDYVSSHFLDS